MEKLTLEELRKFTEDCSDDYEVRVSSVIIGEQSYHTSVFDITSLIDNDGKFLVLEPSEVQVSDNDEEDMLMYKGLSKEDWELITSALMGHSVTMTSECMQCKDVMSKESYERDIKESERLVYLVNVLQGRKEYQP
ncbi:hypothetical protein DZC34_09360 [Clostridium botulinum]|nr:hypothetical protein DZC34_09360 [Clostridium botulinum]